MAIDNVLKNIKEDGLSGEDALSSFTVTSSSLYLLYILRVNKSTGDQLLENEYEGAVKYLARLSLGDNFIPGDIHRKHSALDIKERFKVEGESLVSKCLDNGIIKEEKYNDVIPMIRFLLDPVAEYLCAFSYAEEYKSDLEKWKIFYEKLLKVAQTDTIPYGFLQAMLTVHEEYKTVFHIPQSDQIPVFAEVETLFLKEFIPG